MTPSPSARVAPSNGRNSRPPTMEFEFRLLYDGMSRAEAASAVGRKATSAVGRKATSAKAARGASAVGRKARRRARRRRRCETRRSAASAPEPVPVPYPPPDGDPTQLRRLSGLRRVRDVARALQLSGWVRHPKLNSRGHPEYRRVVWDMTRGEHRRERVSFPSTPGNEYRSRRRALTKLRKLNDGAAWQLGGVWCHE